MTYTLTARRKDGSHFRTWTKITLEEIWALKREHEADRLRWSSKKTYPSYFAPRSMGGSR